METINNIELVDENKYPDEEVLKSVLNESFPAYKQLLELFGNNDMSYEWRYYNDGKAWLCKVQRKKKTIVWMSAWRGYMQAAMYFPERFLDQVCELDISQKLKENFRSAKSVGKSKPFIFQIRDERVLKDFEKVMIFKMECR